MTPAGPPRTRVACPTPRKPFSAPVAHVSKVPTPELRTTLLNDFVGTHEDRGRYCYADGSGNLIVDGHLAQFADRREASLQCEGRQLCHVTVEIRRGLYDDAVNASVVNGVKGRLI